MAGITGVDYIDDSGNRIITGGKLAAFKNKERNPNFYKEIALKAQDSWVRNGKAPRGFSARPDIARIAGAIGGKRSRRTSKKV